MQDIGFDDIPRNTASGVEMKGINLTGRRKTNIAMTYIGFRILPNIIQMFSSNTSYKPMIIRSVN